MGIVADSAQKLKEVWFDTDELDELDFGNV